MDDNFICYDGVEGDITYHENENDALLKLKDLIAEGLEDGEWMHGVENCFVAKIIHHVKEREIEAPEEYRREGISKFIEMDVVTK